MEDLFPTLFSKTFFILGIQLLVTWLSARITLGIFRYFYDHWEIDLYDEARTFSFILPFISIGLFLLLLFGSASDPQAIFIFAIWSIVIGIELTLALISVDEHLGPNLLAITAATVFGTALIGIYSGADFGYLESSLFFALLALILFQILRLFIAIPRIFQRCVAGISIMVFTLYLLFDFNRLSKMSSAGINDWDTAIFSSIEIYLDIINLFLDLLDFLR